MNPPSSHLKKKGLLLIWSPAKISGSSSPASLIKSMFK